MDGFRKAGLTLVLLVASGCNMSYRGCPSHPFGPRPSHRSSIEKIEAVYGTEITYGNLLEYFREGECLLPGKRCLNKKQAKKVRKSILEYMNRNEFSNDDVLDDCGMIGTVIFSRLIQRRYWRN